MQRLGRFYLGYDLVVGGGLSLLMVIATQAARSNAEMFAALLMAVVLPIPMLVVGIALLRGWKRGTALALVLPVAMALCVASTVGRPQPTRAAPFVSSFVFNLCYAQKYLLPGATVLGAMTAIAAMRRRRASMRA